MLRTEKIKSRFAQTQGVITRCGVGGGGRDWGGKKSLPLSQNLMLLQVTTVPHVFWTLCHSRIPEFLGIFLGAGRTDVLFSPLAQTDL